MQEHVEGYLELSAKTKIFFATAVSMWDADFYVKVDDDVHVNIGKDADLNQSPIVVECGLWCFLILIFNIRQSSNGLNFF